MPSQNRLDWTQGELHTGLRCFHSGEFFEAHEHWELVWLKLTEPEKTFLQGIIQITASFHHYRRGNVVGTISLLGAALRRLNQYPETYGGIALAPLRLEIQAWIEALDQTDPTAPPPIPKIKLED